MNAKRFSYLMIAIVILLSIGVVGLTVLGHNIFSKQADKLSNLKAQNQAIKEQEVSLAQAKSDIEKYNSLDEIAKSIVPQDKDQAKTIREINSIASSTGVKLQQVNFSSSNLGQAAPKPAANQEDESTSAPAPKSSGISQVAPVAGISGVYALEITVSSGENNPVSYSRFLQFLEKLEANRRTAHVTTIQVTPTKDRNSVTFSLTLNAYLKP